MTADDEGPLSRWSRRKAATREKQSAVKESDEAAPSLEEEPADVPAPAGGEAAPEEAAPPDLPDIDSLTAESDFTVFMRDGVPDELRKLALRKLWRSDPVLANVDGLVDYGEDFTDAADVVKNLQTAYQVGKGYEQEEPDAADEAESGQEDVTEAPPADEPADGEDGQEAGEGDRDAIAEPGEREPDRSGGTG